MQELLKFKKQLSAECSNKTTNKYEFFTKYKREKTRKRDYRLTNVPRRDMVMILTTPTMSAVPKPTIKGLTPSPLSM